MLYERGLCRFHLLTAGIYKRSLSILHHNVFNWNKKDSTADSNYLVVRQKLESRLRQIAVSEKNKTKTNLQSILYKAAQLQ